MNNWPWPRVLAHRCGGTLAPENTLEGLEVAARFGAGVEFDVMLSGDGTPHLIHDETLERTTSGVGRVAAARDLDLAQLDAGGWFSLRFAGARVPTFADAVRRCRELGLAANVEIKPSAGDERRTGRVVADMARALWQGASLPPLLSSFSEEALEEAAEAAPDVPRGLLVEALPADWRQRCARLGVVAVHAKSACMRQEDVEAVKAAGMWCVLYTENSAETASCRFSWGVDCIITDLPDCVRAPALPASP